jgi:5'-methylthioadenosine phosphorylase
MLAFSGRKKGKLKSSKKIDVAIIGGTGLESLLRDAEQTRVGTPYGLPPPISVGEIEEIHVAFLPRHSIQHSVPPHEVNYRANIYALYTMGAKRIITTNAVGAINPSIKLGDLAVPHDLIDFTKLRQSTFYDSAPVTHIDATQIYCPETRLTLIEAMKKHDSHSHDHAVLVCTEGPRLETPAEIEMFRRLGCDMVGMTGAPEAFLARELEMCYATICFVTNMAAGMQVQLTASELVEMAKKKFSVIEQILRDTVKNLPKERRCLCASALKNARLG